MKRKPLTPEQEQRRALANRPLVGGMVIYTGKIWGGVQVADTFLRDTAEDIALQQMNEDGEFEYDGIYCDAAELELEEFSNMYATDWERR